MLNFSYSKKAQVFAIFFVVTACGGSGDSTVNPILNDVETLSGEFQLVGTSCSDGSGQIRFNEMIVAGVENFRKGYQDYFSQGRLELEEKLDQYSLRRAELDVLRAQQRTIAEESDLNTLVNPEGETEVQRLDREIADLENQMNQVKSDLVFLPIRDDSSLLDIYGGWDSAMTDVELYARLLKLKDEEWSLRLANFLGTNQAWPAMNMPFASERSQSYWSNIQISLEQELGLSRLRSPASLAEGHEYRMAYSADPIKAEPKDPLVQEIYQSLVRSCRDVVQSDIRRELDRSLEMDSSLFENVQSEMEAMGTGVQRYLDEGAKVATSSREDFLQYVAQERVQTSIEFVENDVWLISKNSRNACEQRFPVQAEYQEGSIVNLRPSISNIAYCSESCGPVEREVCDSFSAEVRFIFELMKRTEMSPQEANAFFNQQSKTISFRFHRPNSSEGQAPIVLVRVSNLKKEALRVEATKSLRLVTKEDQAICPEGQDTGFLLTPKLEFSGN